MHFPLLSTLFRLPFTLPSTKTISSRTPVLLSITLVVVVLVESLPPSSSFFSTAPRDGTLHPQAPPLSPPSFCSGIIVAAVSAAGQN